MACTALSRPARSAGASPATTVRPSITSGTATSTQGGTASAPTPYTCAVWLSSGTDSRLPTSTPATAPAAAGMATWSTYATTTCAGEKPTDLSTPIRRVPATTAPLTTLATISTAITSPIRPNATMNGTQGAIEAVALSLVARYDCAPSSAPRGSTARTRAVSALTAAFVPALEKRYSICAVCGVPGARSAASSAGVTQAWAVPVTELATPTTVSRGDPGTPVTVMCDPTDTGGPSPLSDHTTSPACRAQRPAVSVRSSTGPPGEARPTRFNCVENTPVPLDPVKLTCAFAVVSGNGPEAAVTPGSLVVAASWAAEAWVALTVAVTCAPRCAANAWSKGALESTSRPRASVEAAVETSTTRPITTAWTRRPDSPLRAALTAGPLSAIIAVPL